jgi:hypothetical protein
MMIKYVDEVARGAVAYRREKTYKSQDVGSNDLFGLTRSRSWMHIKKSNLEYVVLTQHNLELIVSFAADDSSTLL